MADIKKCDLCGVPYNPYNHNMTFFSNHPDINENLGYANSMFLHIDMDHMRLFDDERLSYKFDICLDCREALLKFIYDRQQMRYNRTEVYVDEE